MVNYERGVGVKRKSLVIVLAIMCFVLLVIVIFRPYNGVELNAGTIYYQSYSQLYVNIKKYVRMLENYYDTEDKIYLEHAVIKLDGMRDNLRIFKLADQIDFRNTFINEKLVKTDFLSENLSPLRDVYYYSWDVLNSFIEEDGLKKEVFQDFLQYNQLILKGLTPEGLGFYKETKEFKITLNESQKLTLEEGLTGLDKIVKNVTRERQAAAK